MERSPRPTFSIGELSRRSGVPVRTIRFYSHIGLVPATTRSDVGYRRYDADALARLEIARTLRDLGFDRIVGAVMDVMRGGRPDTPALRAAIADRFALGADHRVERYWQLMGVINGWPRMPARVPAFEWVIAALRAHPQRA